MGQTDKCQRGGGEGDKVKEGEGISQRAYMHSRWTRTIVWGEPREGRGGWVEVGKEGENGDMHNSANIYFKNLK